MKKFTKVRWAITALVFVAVLVGFGFKKIQKVKEKISNENLKRKIDEVLQSASYDPDGTDEDPLGV